MRTLRRIRPAAETLLIGLLLLLAAAHPAGAQKNPAERVHLKNGDQITGKIVRVAKDVLLIETSYAGTIRVARGEIARITPALPMRVTTRSGETVEGDLLGVTKETLTLRTKGARREFAPPEVWRADIRGREASPWSGSVSAGLSLTQGNADTRAYSARGVLTRETLRDALRLRGNYLFERSGGADRVDRADGDLRIARFLDPVWFVYGRERVEQDRIAEFDLVSDSSVGLGVRLIDTDAARLEFELGPAYHFTRFESGDREEAFSARGGGLLRLVFPGDVKLEIEGEYIQGSKDGEDFIARANIDLVFPVSGGLSLVLSAQERYDNTPAPGRERNDFTLLSSIALTF